MGKNRSAGSPSPIFTGSMASLPPNGRRGFPLIFSPFRGGGGSPWKTPSSPFFPKGLSLPASCWTPYLPPLRSRLEVSPLSLHLQKGITCRPMSIMRLRSCIIWRRFWGKAIALLHGCAKFGKRLGVRLPQNIPLSSSICGTNGPPTLG